MRLPSRDKAHISEASSLRILRNCIPPHWILRDVTERDYGIDCYIEMVDAKHQLTGDLFSVQLKGRSDVKWTADEPPRFHLYDIKIETTNYWNAFSLPVFLFLADLSDEAVYILPVKDYIRQQYEDYLRQDSFSYSFRRDYQLTRDSYLKMVILYFMEKNRTYFETNMLRFFASIKRDREFILENIGRDFFMGVETEREVELRSLIVQIRDLCYHLNIEWDLEDYTEYQKRSQSEFGPEYHIHEKYMSIILQSINLKIDHLYQRCRDIVINREGDFWIHNDNTLFNYLYNQTDLLK